MLATRDISRASGRRQREKNGVLEPSSKDSKYVYAIIAEEIGRVKIGRTSDLALTGAALQRGCPCELRLLKLTPGGHVLEHRLHAELSKWRVIGEWFTASPEVLNAIEQLPEVPFEVGFEYKKVQCPDCGRERLVKRKGSKQKTIRRCMNCSGSRTANRVRNIEWVERNRETLLRNLAKAQAVQAKERASTQAAAEKRNVCIDCDGRTNGKSSSTVRCRRCSHKHVSILMRGNRNAVRRPLQIERI